ncbi:hypothetical protein COH20_005622 [Aspergillus terreus]|uniref:Uncharacterized protein n=1 Tax=Aspergillus terreus TaxID=33178 RepID=A0A5M3YX92_ASPTE|nr:hypothetical protein ATETN484_0004075800 [Aspergillus terreus]GFF13826.1 hypothetical protein COH20_005622 [Aspergillus terreus]
MSEHCGNDRARSRPKRVITPARKEQNRIAQRVYRQRQKERLQRERQCAGKLNTAKDIRPSLPDHSNSQPELVEDVQRGDWPAVDLPGVDQDAAPSHQPPPLVMLTLDHLFPSDSAGDKDTAFATTDMQEYTNTPITPGSSPTDEPDIFLPDPYGSSLELTHTTLLRACVVNASSLGISVEEFFSYKCMSLCSPFYRPNTTMSEDPRSLILSISHPGIPAHLQPTLTQILFPHHPLLDLIPFPAMRTRAITLAATAPNLLDSVDLKTDIVVRGGITCQGGQPWDRRSWRVAPWFWKKWRLLLGDQ